MTPHGTINRYDYHGCRCVPCTEACRRTTEAWRMKARARPREDVPHGTKSGYWHWACRCKACTAAAAEAKRRQRERDHLRSIARQHDAPSTGWLIVWENGAQWVPDASDVPSVVEGKTLAWIIDLEALAR